MVLVFAFFFKNDGKEFTRVRTLYLLTATGFFVSFSTSKVTLLQFELSAQL